MQQNQKIKTNRSQYLSQKRFSPSSIAIVIAMHAAGLGALVIAKPEIIETVISDPPIVTLVETQTVPPPVPIENPEAEIETPIPPVVSNTIVDIQRPQIPRPDPLPELTVPAGTSLPLPPAPPPPPAPEPVLTEASFTRSALANLQPRYPSAMIRQGIEGNVTVRVRVNTNGRVTAVREVSAVHPALFEATRRHALRSWRFTPATRDGRPIETWQTHTVQFRIT